MLRMTSEQILAALKMDVLAAHSAGHTIHMDYEGVSRVRNRMTNTIRWEKSVDGCGLCAAGAHLLSVTLAYDPDSGLDDEGYFARSVGRPRAYGLGFFNGSTSDPLSPPSVMRSIEFYLHHPLSFRDRLEAENGYADGRLMVAWVLSETRPGGLLEQP